MQESKFEDDWILLDPYAQGHKICDGTQYASTVILNHNQPTYKDKLLKFLFQIKDK